MKNREEDIFERLEAYFMGQASERFSEKVISLAYDPINVGEIKNPDGLGFIKGPCGDRMAIFLKITEGKISEAKFLADGCGATIACGCAVTDLAIGKSPIEAESINVLEILRYLNDLPASHEHCAVLAVNTLKEALKNMKKNR